MSRTMTPLMSRLVLMALLFSAAPVSADLIRLRDGEEYTGKVLRRSPTEVVVQFEFGTMSLSPEEIIAVEPQAVEEPSAPVAPPEHAADASLSPAPGQDPGSSSMPSVEPPAAIELPEAMKAVAFIGSVFQDGSVGVGSGTLINRKGVMVTNYHVVGQATGVGVLLPRFGPNKVKPSRPYEARVLKVDPCYELALVSIPVKTPAYLRFADDEEAITSGAEVRAIGNPQGLAISVSRGIISAVRTLKDLGMGLVDVDDFSTPECAHLSGRTLESVTFIQTDAAINPGNSGGPLLNAKNEIIGINTFIFSESGGSVGLNFALHVKHVKRFVGSYAKE